MALRFPTTIPIFAAPTDPSSSHIQSLPTEVNFSKWNNANAGHFESRRRAQEEIERDIRLTRRFQSVDNIASSSSTTTTPSKPSFPGRKSKYSKPPKFRTILPQPVEPLSTSGEKTLTTAIDKSNVAVKEFDSFVLRPPNKKGVNPVQSPGPFLPGSPAKYMMTREEILGEPLTPEEIDSMVESCLRTSRQLNIGRDGLTHNLLDNIHAHWKRRPVCKIKCKEVCSVDMDNVKQQLEDKTGGKVIHVRGGALFLFRGRNYNYRTRPSFPLMLSKPVSPVYPRLVKRVSDGLKLEQTTIMCRKGRTLIPICKLGKNGVYKDLVPHVREAFKTCELVRINCQGMNGSDYKKIGGKLKDLVPCVLISFELEHILMWRGPEWKSS